jgi:hypothetical protein
VRRHAAMLSDGEAHEFRANRIGEGCGQDPINLGANFTALSTRLATVSISKSRSPCIGGKLACRPSRSANTIQHLFDLVLE